MVDNGPGSGQDHINEALLSDYLDEQIEDLETAQKVQDHLQRCDACQQALAELRLVTVLLAELPEPELPRSFRLTPEMVPEMAPVRLVQQEPWFLRFQPALRWATAAAALLLVLVLSADLALNRPGTPVVFENAVTISAQPMAGGAGSATSAGSQRASEATAADDAGAPAPAAGSANDGATEAAADAAASQEIAGAQAGAASEAAGEAPEATAPEALAATPAETLAAPDDGSEATGQDFVQVPEPRAVSSLEEPAAAVSVWRVAELALGLVILWLLTALVALPRLRRTRG